MMREDLSFVFVVTVGRSGSTLLMNLLNAIDGYDLKGENGGTLFHLYRASEQARITKKRFGALPRDKDHPWYGAHAVEFEGFSRDLVDRFVAEFLRPDAATKVTGFKEIRYTPNLMTNAEFEGFMRFLLTAFPTSKIIFNKRNPQSVAKSGWWAKSPTETVLDLIRKTYRRFDAFHKKEPERTVMVHYDEYTQDYSKLEPLFAFLGEPFDLKKVESVAGKQYSLAMSKVRAAKDGADQAK